MTNEQAKQEAIKRAWEKYGYKGIFPSNANGWMRCIPGQFQSDKLDRLKINSELHSIRPISLKNIENNNGWIRIEPDGSNLPKQSLDCKMIVKGFDYVKTGWFDTYLNKENPKFLYKEDRQIWEYKGVTHYKPITPELKPIY